MAELAMGIFGAVGTGIASLDLILKRVGTFRKLKRNVKGAAAEVSRRSRDLELRTGLLRNIRVELDPSNLQGAPIAVACLDDCINEMRQLKAILKIFETQIATGKSWRELLQTGLEYAWKKEEMDELYKDICSANEKLADAMTACQL